MEYLTIQKAKDYFRLGVISRVELHRVPVGKGWNIFFVAQRDLDHVGFLSDRRTGSPRVFLDLDRAVGVVERIGQQVRGVKVF